MPKYMTFCNDNRVHRGGADTIGKPFLLQLILTQLAVLYYESIVTMLNKKKVKYFIIYRELHA